MEGIWSLNTLRNVIDIVLVLLIACYAYRLLRKSGAVNLFWGLFAFVAIWFITGYVFHLQLTSALFNQIVSVGAIAIIVIFQKEIRMFFYSIGSRVGKGLPRGKIRQAHEDQRLVGELYTALVHMSADKQGALVVITRQQNLDEYADSGEEIDAVISARLIENIFFKNSPLHDGALIITAGRIRSAACVLPVSSNRDIPQELGLRHRAAVGLTERTDAIALVVSEQTGGVSLAESEKIRPVTNEELMQVLNKYLNA